MKECLAVPGMHKIFKGLGGQQALEKNSRSNIHIKCFLGNQLSVQLATGIFLDPVTMYTFLLSI